MAARPERVLETLDELERLVVDDPELCIRYSEGPEKDGTSSTDTESGLELPGLSVNPLRPEEWWSRPLADWLARQLCQYKHLSEKNPDRFAWVLRGRTVGRGPDNEPLLADVEPVARLSDALLDEAERRYEERFEAGQGPED
ncbi:hypothetical protein CLV46_0923 [Diaminobutyricimonas aerilata]|uniref:Uncharacterized protein n=1 Tax=Diaminobutyricimonas aerilata TaxID=1162967 RepID=A0A2M9CHL7_9MICO|nr:DUF6098 family protein [Diaminobutyricimonas aerilata]PJJ71378.1 hypothetical protein CLV46_0923 [Diaminobutyricimonas aerilata]